MKGDFSRIRFNPAKQYAAVLEQQGRVALDADANEQTAIDSYLRKTTNTDVVGRYGGPVGDAGFAISLVGDQIQIGRGRYYVEGLLVENEAIATYDDQPFLIDATYSAAALLQAVASGGGKVTAQLYLEVWQRLVTQLDDSCLREPALSQADTTARLQTVWRVAGSLGASSPSTSPQGSSSPLSSCCQSMYHDADLVHRGALGADTTSTGTDCGCQPIPSAGYQGLENQLYRVEIHTSGDLGSATFKWSRENASVVTQITEMNGAVVTVSSIGPDANLGYQAGQCVELTDDTYLFGQPPNQPGVLYQIVSIQPSGGKFRVTLSAQVMGIDPKRNARMRRWDQSGPIAAAHGVPLSASPIPLENGIEVTFQKGVYTAGDYWTIPARTANGQIDWPPCGMDQSFFQPPQSTMVYRAPLACIHPAVPTSGGYGKLQFNRFVVDDCRLFFSPLTALASDTALPALHVQSVSWINDDVMTVDALLAKGLSVTLDQAPACPWSGANFRVTLEAPFSNEPTGQFAGVPPPPSAGQAPAGTDVFLRTELVLDPPTGITVAGAQVNWLLPPVQGTYQSYSTYWLFTTLNTLLIGSKATGYGRMRVRLDGASIFGTGAGSNLYLDGQSYTTTGARAVDGSQNLQLALPSGHGAKASDFTGWFYLAPTVLIAGVVIQGIEGGNPVTLSAVTVTASYSGVLSFTTGVPSAPIQVTGIRALITLTYAPIVDTPVSLTFSGTGAGTVVTIQSSVTVPAGQLSLTAPITIHNSPGQQVTDTVSLSASVSTAVGNFPFNPIPSLAITGGFAVIG